MDVFRDRPVLAFFGLTMAISWGLWWPMAGGYVESAVAERVAVFGPTITALVLTGYLHGREGITRLGRRLLHWQVGPRWYLFSIGFSPALLLVAVGIHRVMGGSLPPLSLPDLPIIVIGFVYVLLTSVAGEELGWRGFALPRLQRSYSALVASFLLGLVWFLWHLPLFYTAGDFHRFIPLELFVLQIIGFSVLYSGCSTAPMGVYSSPTCSTPSTTSRSSSSRSSRPAPRTRRDRSGSGSGSSGSSWWSLSS